MPQFVNVCIYKKVKVREFIFLVARVISLESKEKVRACFTMAMFYLEVRVVSRVEDKEEIGTARCVSNLFQIYLSYIFRRRVYLFMYYSGRRHRVLKRVLFFSLFYFFLVLTIFTLDVDWFAA